jgi:hypothetical protein
MPKARKSVARSSAPKEGVETKKVDLRHRVRFEDQYYGPGKDVEVPKDFPVDDDET